jgi:hypothetical protein
MRSLHNSLPKAGYDNLSTRRYRADLRPTQTSFLGSGRQHVLAAAGTAGLIIAMNVYLLAATFAQ